MTARTPLKLSVLRDIGFVQWDPIGLLAEGEAWDHQPFADEYDQYLLAVAYGLRRDWTVENAAAFLREAERESMGLGSNATSQTRAEATAKAIKEYLQTLAIRADS